MQSQVEQLLYLMHGAWRFRRQGLLAASIVCLLGWLIVLAIPDNYQSRARVYVDTRTPLRPLLQGIAVDQEVESQLIMVRQAMLGKPNLEKVARATDPTFDAKSRQERDLQISSLAQRVQIELEPPVTRDPRVPNTLYGITYTDHDRDQAIRVVELLLNAFVEATMGSNRTGSASAQRFLQSQLTEYESRLAEAESKLATFKKEHVGMVPGAEGGYFPKLQGELDEVKRLQSALTVATNRRQELERQKNGEMPYVPGGLSGAARQPGQAVDTQSRIQEAQTRLDELLLRFTDRHPDVIATRETLVELQKRREEELAALKRGDASAAAAASAAANPIYQNIQLAINQTDVEIAALRGDLANRERNVAELRKLVNTAPEVEADYARLTRDYEVIRTQYNAVLDRLERARVSGDAEQSGVAQFDIIDPPAASYVPVSPNRKLLLPLILLVGLGIGVGVAYLLHMMRPVFSNTTALESVTGLPVLGAVKMAWLDRRRNAMRLEYVRYAAAAVILVIMGAAVTIFASLGSRLIRQLIS
jgi:protein tyrosine kinase modulator